MESYGHVGEVIWRKRGQIYLSNKEFGELNKSVHFFIFIFTIATRTAKNTTRLGGEAGEPGVKITYKDGAEFDMTSTRVKETEANPYVPGATRPVRYEDALDNKGVKRASTQQELDWFNNIKW